MEKSETFMNSLTNGSHQEWYGSVSVLNEDTEYVIPIVTSFQDDFDKGEAATLPTVSTGSTIASMISETDSSIELNEPDLQSGVVDHFFQSLGFSHNPLASNSGAGSRNSSVGDMRLAMLSNFSTAYNVVSIGLALHIMDRIYPATSQDRSVCSSALIAGMIIGQLVGGAVGDILGRHLAMAVVMALQVLGAIASASSVDGRYNIYWVVAGFRFIVGLGCGGVYPLAATITAEASDNKEDGAKATALTFSMQGVAYVVAPLLTWALLAVVEQDSDFAWRILLGFGGIPGLMLMFLRFKRQQELRQGSSSSSPEPRARPLPVSLVDAIKMEDDLVKKMLGTGGCWFLFDVLFYGNTLFQATVLSAAFGSTETLKMTARDATAMAFMALPGYFVSVAALGKQSPRLIQAQGFLVMGILYAYIGYSLEALADNRIFLLLVYGLTFFFSNYGPNATTYVLPSVTFSKPCRATLNGVSSACGKAGALLGTMVFATSASKFGAGAVLISCSGISFIAMFLTLWCVNESVCRNARREEIRNMEKRLSKVPMKWVFSLPSLVDYYDDA